MKYLLFLLSLLTLVACQEDGSINSIVDFGSYRHLIDTHCSYPDSAVLRVERKGDSYYPYLLVNCESDMVNVKSRNVISIIAGLDEREVSLSDSPNIIDQKLRRFVLNENDQYQYAGKFYKALVRIDTTSVAISDSLHSTLWNMCRSYEGILTERNLDNRIQNRMPLVIEGFTAPPW